MGLPRSVGGIAGRPPQSTVVDAASDADADADAGAATAALVSAARKRDRGALARLLSFVERGGHQARSVAHHVYGAEGDAYTVGITGAPGSGKSTLVNALVHRIRAEDVAVAVLAIDPSSPFTGGAILGDRVRMGDHDLDPGVFVRSMATRGHLGGLSLATPEAARVLEVAGFGWVLIETVGVGQVEVEVAGAADTTVVVVNPGWGDRVQANKAGLLEIADVFVINKADRPGAKETRRDLLSLLRMQDERDGWTPPVVSTVAETGDGVDELWETVGAHRAHLESTGGLSARRQRRLADELRAVVTERLRARADAALGAGGVAAIESEVVAGRLDPYDAADQILDPDPGSA